MNVCLFLSLFLIIFIAASVSVRNIRNIPKVPLTVKPDPNDTLNRSLNHVNGTTSSNAITNNSNSMFYYDTNYMKQEQQQSNSMYINGQAQQHHQQQLQMQQQQHHQQQQQQFQQQQHAMNIQTDPAQHQYAVVKKNGSKRDIRENLERENSAIFKVSHFVCFYLLVICHVFKSGMSHPSNWNVHGMKSNRNYLTPALHCA